MKGGMKLLQRGRKLQTVGGLMAGDDLEWPNEAGLQFPGGVTFQPEVGCAKQHPLTCSKWTGATMFISLLSELTFSCINRLPYLFIEQLPGSCKLLHSWSIIYDLRA